MALTKIGKEGITGISNASDATFLTATSGEGVTLAGTLAVTGIHTVGTNAVATSEGGAVTTNIAQGLGKCWVNFAGNGTIAARDSLNVGSLTDNGTGDYTVNFTNNMNNDDYAVSWNAGLKTITWGLPIFVGLSGAGNTDCFSTSKYRVGSSNPADGLEDNNMCNAISLGDLA